MNAALGQFDFAKFRIGGLMVNAGPVLVNGIYDGLAGKAGVFMTGGGGDRLAVEPVLKFCGLPVAEPLLERRSPSLYPLALGKPRRLAVGGFHPARLLGPIGIGVAGDNLVVLPLNIGGERGGGFP